MIELSLNTNEYSVIQTLKVMHINTLRREIALKNYRKQLKNRNFWGEIPKKLTYSFYLAMSD